MGDIIRVDFRDLYEDEGFYPQSFLPLELRQAGEGKNRVFEGVATKAGLDLNDVFVTSKALRGAQRDLLSMSTVLKNHRFDREVGRITDSKFDDASKELRVRGIISRIEDEVWTKMREGILSNLSISWRNIDFQFEFDEELEKKILVVESMRIVETSIVSVPGMPGSEITSVVERSLMNRDFVIDRRLEVPIDKPYIVPFERTPSSSSDKWGGSSAERRLRRWAGGPRKDKINWNKYARGFAIVRPPGNRFGDFLFPHHDIRGGRFVSVKGGVSNAVSRLPGSNLSNKEKRAVAEHLRKELLTVHDVDEEDLSPTIEKFT